MDRKEVIEVLEDLRNEMRDKHLDSEMPLIQRKRYEALTYAIALTETWDEMLKK